MKIKQVGILGGTGFVGRYLASALVRRGQRVRVLSRHPQRHRDLVSREVAVLETDIHNPQQLRERLQGVDAVFNLVGIHNESGSSGFVRAHVEVPKSLVSACSDLGIGRILHMSALHAGDVGVKSNYMRTKGEGEALAHEANSQGIAVSSFQPSVIFGHKDSFLNRFATLLRLSPVLPLACPNAKMAPIYIEDVVNAMVSALENPSSHGQRYPLCGPKVYTLLEIVEYIAQVLSLSRIILPLSSGLSRLEGEIMEWIPGKPFSVDNYLSLQVDSTCAPGVRLPFGIQATPLEVIAPYALGKQPLRNRYPTFREQAGRDPI